MTVSELIDKLKELNPNSEVFISCEAGCVKDNDIAVYEKDDKIILEIE